jgi:hypothetical protein
MTQPTEVEGVEATVLEARRGDADTVMVRWQLENKTGQRTKYPVAQTPDRVPVAAKYGAQNEYAVLPPKKKIALWAKFNAPPAGVDKTELYLPTVSLPFEGVELK